MPRRPSTWQGLPLAGPALALLSTHAQRRRCAGALGLQQPAPGSFPSWHRCGAEQLGAASGCPRGLRLESLAGGNEAALCCNAAGSQPLLCTVSLQIKVSFPHFGGFCLGADGRTGPGCAEGAERSSEDSGRLTDALLGASPRSAAPHRPAPSPAALQPWPPAPPLPPPQSRGAGRAVSGPFPPGRSRRAPSSPARPGQPGREGSARR